MRIGILVTSAMLVAGCHNPARQTITAPVSHPATATIGGPQVPHLVAGGLQAVENLSALGWVTAVTVTSSLNESPPPPPSTASFPDVLASAVLMSPSDPTIDQWQYTPWYTARFFASGHEWSVHALFKIVASPEPTPYADEQYTPWYTTRFSAGAHLCSVDELLDVVASPEPIPYAERQAAKDELIRRPYDQVLPKLAVRISHAPPEWSRRIYLSGVRRDFGNEQSPPGEQAIVALHQVWGANTYGPKPPAFAHDLVTYLSDPVFHDLRYWLIPEISIRWCDEAEEPITRLFDDAHESPQLRFEAGYALMEHARDKNLDKLLDFAEANPGRDEEFFIDNLMHVGFPQYGDRPADSRLLKVADDIMEKDIRDTGQLSDGYLMASSMGDFIATRGAPPDARNLPNPFAADQDAPGNRKPDGNLSEKFFETPVIKARAWWDQHGRAVRLAATEPVQRGSR